MNQDNRTEEQDQPPAFEAHFLMKSGAEIVVDLTELDIKLDASANIFGLTWENPSDYYPGLGRRSRQLQDITLSEIAAIWTVSL